jgi:hypothetical protein
VQPESVIKKHLEYALRLQGWLIIPIAQAQFSAAGVADMAVVRDGRTVWVEVKTATGKQSAHQKAFEAAVKAHGGEYIVASKLEDLKEAGMIDGIIGVGQ